MLKYLIIVIKTLFSALKGQRQLGGCPRTQFLKKLNFQQTDLYGYRFFKITDFAILGQPPRVEIKAKFDFALPLA